MPHLDDFILWKSSLLGGAETLGPERGLLVTAPPLPNKGTRFSVVGRNRWVPLSTFGGFELNGQPALYLLSDPDGLVAEKALPSADILFAPRFPELALQALVSSSAVISFSLLPAVVAIGHRIPALVVSDEPQTMLLADRLGIPCLKPAPAHQLLPAIREAFENHRWEVTFLNAELLKQKLPSVRASGSSAVWERQMTVALIADEKFLPQLNGLVHNLKDIGHVDFQFEVLALDDATADFIASLDARVNCHRFKDLWKGTDPAELDSWSTADKSFRSKPAFLLKLVRATQGAVFYFDCDLFFLRCPSSLLAEFGESSLLLFPNWNDSPEDTKRWGVFNAGLFGVMPGCERFLEVWSSFCATVYQSHQRGYVCDQGFLDLVPLYLDNFTVYRRGDENVAKWNQLTREEGTMIRSFHASQPDFSGFFERKMLWDQAHWVFADPKSRFAVASRWSKLLGYVWREEHLPLSRWLGFSALVRRWAKLPWLDSPRVTKFFVYGAGRFVMNLGALVRRRVLPEHGERIGWVNNPWVAQQQLTIREATARKKGLLPSLLPFDIGDLSELANREANPLSGSPLEIH